MVITTIWFTCGIRCKVSKSAVFLLTKIESLLYAAHPTAPHSPPAHGIILLKSGHNHTTEHCLPLYSVKVHDCHPYNIASQVHQLCVYFFIHFPSPKSCPQLFLSLSLKFSSKNFYLEKNRPRAIKT